jgi:chemotaxis protein CheZ
MSTEKTGAGGAPTEEDTIARLGRITRQLHEAVVALGLDNHIRRVAGEIPDARDRLAYVGQMTENAAQKVLNLVELASPACTGAQSEANRLVAELEGAARSAQDPAQAALLQRAAEAQRAQAAFAVAQAEHLTQIMMAQDFQDLSGQVIKKVIGIISQTESQLLGLLMDSKPEHLAALVQADNKLEGPQVPEKALKQDDVDALLAAMDF